MIPGVLEVISHNLNQSQQDMRFFEIGRVYQKTGRNPDSLEGYVEEERLLLAMNGRREPLGPGSSSAEIDLLDMKGEVQALLSKFFLDKSRLIYYDSDKALTVDNVGVEIQGTYVGYFGKVKREAAVRFDIEQDVYVGEFLVGPLTTSWQNSRRFVAPPSFPSVTRDLAFVVKDSVANGELESAIRKSAGPILSSVQLFDIYAGPPLEPGTKSLAYALVIQPYDRTLTDDQANVIIERIVEGVQAACGARLRA